MRESGEPREQVGPPGHAEPSGTPGPYQAQTSLEHFIAQTLSEIQHDQGRNDERFKYLSTKMDVLTEKIDRLVADSASSRRSLDELGPRVDKHNALYNKLLGASAGTMALLVFVGGLLYWTNASRLDKILKILDSPGIEKILRKDR